jgi:uncharacterized protein (TIGR02996 family)
MNDENAFQAALDANPGDHTTRLVLADWLQEHGDPRAEGYRALGVLRLQPCHLDAECFTPEHPAARTPEYLDKFWWCNAPAARYEQFRLPRDWYQRLTWPGSPDENYATRREAEDAAALAFSKLPPKRRAALLAGKVTELKTAKRKAVKRKERPKRKAEPKKTPRARGKQK